MTVKFRTRAAAPPLLALLTLSTACPFQALAEPTGRQYDGSAGYTAYYPPRRPSAEEMLGDGLVVRPASLAGTIIGAGVFIATLPFSALSGNLPEAAERLVGEPAAYTFTRCFGCVGTRYPEYWYPHYRSPQNEYWPERY